MDIRLLKSKISCLAPYWKMECDNTVYARLYYIKRGTGYIRTHGKEYTLKAGHMYLVPPRGNLAYGYGNDLEIWWVHFTASVHSSFDLFDYLSYDIEILPEDIIRTEKDMKDLVELARSEKVADHMKATGILLQFLSNFFVHTTHQIHSLHQEKIARFMPVIEYIEEHLGESLPTGELAKLANYERSHFSTLFKKIFDISPVQYINRKRIDNIQFMLQTTSATLNDLADRYGFSDAFHLSKVFKKYTGVSPSEFRETSRESIP